VPDLRENLLTLAEHGFHAAAQLCKACYHYHALWGYERLAGIKSNGFETERDFLEPLLNSELREQGRVLIAGADDLEPSSRHHGRGPLRDTARGLSGLRCGLRAQSGNGSYGSDA